MDAPSWSLRQKPSVKGWIIELGDILRGNRVSYLASFGNAAEYVKSTLLNSRNRSRADYCFAEALRRVVEPWHPMESTNTGRDSLMLQLLGAFTPSEGVTRVLELLRSFIDLEQAGSEAEITKLKSTALQVLEQYFPVEQYDQGPFREYIIQLRRNLTLPDYVVYSVARLRALRRFRLSECGILFETASRRGQLMRAVVAVFASGLREDDRDLPVLSFLYGQSLRAWKESGAPGVEEFTSGLREVGLEPRIGSGGPEIASLTDSWSVPLDLGNSDREIYYERVYYPDESRSGGEHLSEVVEESEAEGECLPATSLSFSSQRIG